MRERFVRCLGTSIIAAAMVAMGAGMGRAQDVVNFGYLNLVGDIPFLFADEAGYFKQENIQVNFVQFDSAAKMIPALGVGQLDAGVGSANAALYNAVARGIGIKIVADKARFAPGYGSQALMVRKDLIDSGAFKSLADLKGRKVAMISTATNEASAMNEAMLSVGLTFNDFQKLLIPQPQQTVAFQNGAIEASIASEPFVSILVKSNLAVRFAGTDVFYPNAQTGVLFYGDLFIKKRKDVAARFMCAYIRGLRAYNDALKDGYLAGPGSEDMISVITKRTNVTDRDLVKSMIAIAVDPNGEVGVESLKKDFEFFKKQGQLEGQVTVEQVLDRSFATDAVKVLGAYRKSGS